MYKINDFVVYKQDVCKVREIKNVNGKNYYVLIPIKDNSLIINVPIDNELLLRNVISKKEALKLIDNIKNIKPLELENEKEAEKVYKIKLASGKHEDIIEVIKTTYIRNENRIKNKKKQSEKDLEYFELAEKNLYTELSISLKKDINEIKKLIYEKCNSK